MLYCPKCQQTYEEGVQRFCPNDNARLLPSNLAGNSDNQPIGVFTSVLNRKSNEEGDKFSSVPSFSQVAPTNVSRPSFRPPTSKIFKTDPEFEMELEAPRVESKSPFVEPLEHLIKPNHSANEELPPVEEKTKSVFDNDLIFDLNSPTSLVNQTIKNRFRIFELTREDENGIAYLAEDTSTDNRKVVINVLTAGDADDSFADKIFAEERASLVQMNCPNIADVIDTGILPGNIIYLVSEFVEGVSVKELLGKTGQFNALRTARIIRQSADALGAAHRGGILHRDLKPENIVLFVDENGMERVKLTDFGASKGKLNKDNLLYKSPEQVEGKVANFTSDGYSLAVIAYQMLTNRMPFNAVSVGDMLRAQREGLKLLASDLRDDLPATLDACLKKALSFNPFDRYEKVQDFGDEFFGEIIANAPLEDDEDFAETIADEEIVEPELLAPRTLKEEAPEIALPVVIDDNTPTIQERNLTESGVKATEDLAWEKRSPEMPNEPSARRNLLSLLGVAALLAVLLGVWYYFINRPNQTFVSAPIETVNQNAPVTETSPIAETNANNASIPGEVEAPPAPRTIRQPPDSVYFQNTKENLKGDALKNFLGFSLYYPKNWKVNKLIEESDSKTRSKFLDISIDASSGTPIEQFLVSYYNSKGTFNEDSEIFPSLVNETNTTLKKIVPNYEMISKGEITINNGWRAYEVKFKGTGKTANGENITLWGRRMFVPTAIRGMKNGYVITMLATSISNEVKSVDDVGVKGDLSSILETFEPSQKF